MLHCPGMRKDGKQVRLVKKASSGSVPAAAPTQVLGCNAVLLAARPGLGPEPAPPPHLPRSNILLVCREGGAGGAGQPGSRAVIPPQPPAPAPSKRLRESGPANKRLCSRAEEWEQPKRREEQELTEPINLSLKHLREQASVQSLENKEETPAVLSEVRAGGRGGGRSHTPVSSGVGRDWECGECGAGYPDRASLGRHICPVTTRVSVKLEPGEAGGAGGEVGLDIDDDEESYLARCGDQDMSSMVQVKLECDREEEAEETEKESCFNIDERENI